MAVRRPLFALLGALVLISGIAPLARPATVAAVSPDLVISQVYGGGGNSGATYTHDFIELYNRGASAVDITGWSVQYASATGATWTNKTDLTGTVAADGYYLIQEASGAGGTTPLPTPDATGTIAMSGTAGKVALVTNTTFLVCTVPACDTAIGVRDFVGYGATANDSETAPTATLTNTTAAIRAAGGATDTDNNSSDFTTGAPNPRNSSFGDPPTLNIDDVTQNEGDSGTTTFSFSVTLSSDAGAGGVTFDIATADDTATEGDDDYVGQSLTGQSIPEDSDGPYQFNVTVNGDTDIEDDERFFVNVTNITGATGGDTQGDGTITNDDSASPTDPSGVGAASPSSVVQGGSTLLSVDVTPGGSPASTGIDVEVDATSIGGQDDVNLFDNGLNGDVTSGDGTYSLTVTVDAGTTPGAKSLPFTITDDQARTGTGDIALTVTASPCDGSFVPIHDIQGNGTSSPLNGTPVTTRGIVTGDFETSATGLSGFFMQTPDAGVDADPLTSEGMFVFNGSANNNVSVGDDVVVSGTVFEFQPADDPLTEISPVTAITVCSTGNVVPTATTVTLPESTQGDLERYENMRIQITQTLTVQQTFFTARFGEVSLASGGRLLNPTNQFPAASAERAALHDENQRRLIFLDDGRSAQNVNPVPYFQAGTNTLRSGDTTSSTIVGFLDAGPINTGTLPRDYRIQPENMAAITFAGTNPRPAAPESVGGVIQVAAANVLNYFNTIDETGSPGCFPGGGRSDCRGADSSAEFTRQRDKIINELISLDADVVGLMEIENDGESASSAIQDLVDGLNAATAPGTWAFVATGHTNLGGDAIKVAMLYQPAAVTPTGSPEVDLDTVHNRPPLAQRFTTVANGESLWVVVNHFKSKGCGGETGGDVDSGDGQGCFNATRLAQANRLLTWINSTLAPTDPDVAVIGDLNAYAKEDPILAFEAGGYVNQIAAHAGATAYSYVFDSYSGYLDHFLTSESLSPHVVDVTEWHINADEPGYIDYNLEFKQPACATCGPDFYTSAPYRSSDHDPVLAGIFQIADLSITKTDSPDPVLAGGTITYTITVSNDGPDAATATSWTDTLPAETTFVSLSAVADWTCTTPAVGATGTIDCDHADPFANGSDDEFTLVVMVWPGVPAATVISNTATVSSDTAEGNAGDESDTALTTVAAPPNPDPVASFTATPDRGYAPLLVQFDASASSDDGTIDNYHWDFGDGTSADTAGPTTSHTYTAGCNCTATLTVTDDGGATDDASQQVDVIRFFWRMPTRGTPNFNEMTAGAMNPVYFSLSGNHGLDVFEDGFPRSRPISCITGAVIGTGNWQLASATTPPLKYNVATNRYTFRWVTRTAWAGTCRLFQVRLDDGPTYKIWVHFNAPAPPTAIRP